MVVLNNIRSLYNVGSIFRTADGVGVEKIWLCGITGYPPQSQISKIALGAEERVPWEYCDDTIAVVGNLKNMGYHIALLEQMDGSVEYHEFQPNCPICLVVGNEKEGVSQELVALCDTAVEIEMMGIKNSLNVAVAFGVIAYHLKYYLKGL
jgi:tRNA G18 (ribose-2'-O)-methylase SpoU